MQGSGKSTLGSQLPDASILPKDTDEGGFYATAIPEKAGIHVNVTREGSFMGTYGTRRQFLASVGAVAAALQTFGHIRPYDVLAADTANLKEIVKPFYTDCLTVNTRVDVATIMNRLLADDFQSINSAETKGKAQLIGQVQFFWKLMPDLKWEIQEMLQEGNKVVARSIASGSPKGEFMGLNLDGSKSFKIMTIDIHTLEGQQMKQVYHLEEWLTAIKQLKA
jgi:predicted ester cyclase